MREEEKAENGEDEDACFRGCCRVLKTTNRGTSDDDENVFPKVTFRLAKDLVNVNAMMASSFSSAATTTTNTTTNTNNTNNKAGKKNQRLCIKMFTSNASSVYLSRMYDQPVAIKLPILRTKTDIDRTTASYESSHL